jgi:hypothetical protein
MSRLKRFFCLIKLKFFRKEKVMITYENCILYGVSENDLPAKGFLQLTGDTGRRKIYQFYPAPEGRWLYLWSGFIEIISGGEIIDDVFYYHGHEKMIDTIFLLEDDGIFDPLEDDKFGYKITQDGTLKKVRLPK